VSTVGVIETMKKLTDELKGVKLALSLHAPNQDLRQKIVPSAMANKLDNLMEALDYFIAYHNSNATESWISHMSNKTMEASHLWDLCATGSTKALRGSNDVKGAPNGKETASSADSRFSGRRLMIEYILLKDVNDRAEHAYELVRLLGPRRKHLLVNLIPYNPAETRELFERPDKETILTFLRICEQAGIYTRIRTVKNVPRHQRTTISLLMCLPFQLYLLVIRWILKTPRLPSWRHYLHCRLH